MAKAVPDRNVSGTALRKFRVRNRRYAPGDKVGFPPNQFDDFERIGLVERSAGKRTRRVAAAAGKTGETMAEAAQAAADSTEENTDG